MLFLDFFRVSRILPSLCFWFGLCTWLNLRNNFWLLIYGTGTRSAMEWCGNLWMKKYTKVHFCRSRQDKTHQFKMPAKFKSDPLCADTSGGPIETMSVDHLCLLWVCYEAERILVVKEYLWQAFFFTGAEKLKAKKKNSSTFSARIQGTWGKYEQKTQF